MSQTKAHPDHLHNHETKQHPEAEEQNLHSVPAPDDGGHAKSHAAHLHTGADAHTMPAGDLRQGSAPSELREPPQEVSRVGKGHHRE